MTNDQIKRLAIDVINDANAEIAKLNMHKNGWLSLRHARVKAEQDGRITTANAFLDAVAREESAAIIDKARRAA
ncbi:MAG: hypothetical protein WBA83_17005 [Burkholderiaceae bacterium]